jgi:hypothetical protein
VPVNVTSFPSCPYAPTGTATATTNSSNSYTCTWKSPQTNFPASQLCSVTKIPAGAELTVIVTNIIGCVGQSYLVMGTRPPFVFNQLSRTTFGFLGQIPCNDTAVISVYGGLYAPNYTVFLIGDTTGANITYNRSSHLITLTAVCRAVQYVVGVTDADGLCLQTFISYDPYFNFGGDGNNITYPSGLPPFIIPTGGEFGSPIGPPPPPVPEPPLFYLKYWPGLLTFAIVFVCGVGWTLYWVIKRDEDNVKHEQLNIEAPLIANHYRRKNY